MGNTDDLDERSRLIKELLDRCKPLPRDGPLDISDEVYYQYQMETLQKLLPQLSIEELRKISRI